MLTVIIIPADDEEDVREVEIEGSLRELQAIVVGLITFSDLRKIKASIISSDEGLLIGLRPNIRATELLYRGAPEHEGYTLLVGDCIVVGWADENGNTMSAPPEAMEWLS